MANVGGLTEQPMASRFMEQMRNTAADIEPRYDESHHFHHSIDWGRPLQTLAADLMAERRAFLAEHGTRPNSVEREHLRT